MAEPIKIRPLTNRDLKTLAKMISKIASKFKPQILSAIKKREKSDTLTFDIVELFQCLVDDLSDELFAWFADLIGKSPEEFDQMSPSTTVDIIEALIKQEDFRDFLARVSRLIGNPISGD